MNQNRDYWSRPHQSDRRSRDYGRNTLHPMNRDASVGNVRGSIAIAIGLLIVVWGALVAFG